MRSKSPANTSGHSIRKLRWQLVALFTVIFGVTLVTFSALLYQQFVRIHQVEFDASLYNYAVDIARSMEKNFLGNVTLTPNLLTDGEKIFPFALGESLIQVRSLNGKTLARSRSLGKSSLPWPREDQMLLPAQKAVFRTIPGGYRSVSYYLDRAARNDLILQVAVPMRLLVREEEGLQTFFSIAIPTVIALSLLGGLYLSWKALTPLQEAIRSQETFVADASHQLKTPLSILRNEIDWMNSRKHVDPEVGAFLKSISQETKQLSRMVENLLILAQTDAPFGAFEFQKLRMDELILEVVSRQGASASAKSITIQLNLLPDPTSQQASNFEIQAEPVLLKSALMNILDNSIKYSPEGGAIAIELESLKDAIEIRVFNSGRQISEEAASRLFERFSRADPQSQVRGAGLGLAIVKRIVELHRGEVSLTNVQTGGVIFKARLSRINVG